MEWKELALHPRSLADARLQLHHATQLVSGLGRTFAEKRDDDSHTALTWSTELKALTGVPLDGVRASLALGALELLVTSPAGQATGFVLASATLAEAEQWLLHELAKRSKRPVGDCLAPLHYEIPPHRVARGAEFSHPGLEFVELARWYANAYALLGQVASEEADTTPILCWPHHFDIALLIELDRGAEADRPRTIGVGMSPGDEAYDEPYLYVGPYPRPDDPALPPLANGQWRTEGAFNAVLCGSEIRAAGEGLQQKVLAQSFFREAIAASHDILRAK